MHVGHKGTLPIYDGLTAASFNQFKWNVGFSYLGVGECFALRAV